MVSRMLPMDPSIHHPHDLRHPLEPVRCMVMSRPPFQDHIRPEVAGLCSPRAEDAYKGTWSDMEDEELRSFSEVRNATTTACDASRCRSKCVELACPHNWCSEDHCFHGRCTETECAAPSYVYRRPAPEGSLVMQPLDATLCGHLTNTEKLWTEIASQVSRRCNRKRNAKQCRERWFQQLRPGLILNLPIQPEEAELITELVREKGQKWAEISRHPRLQRRSDNAIKNWWNSSGNKKDRASGGSARMGRVVRPISPQQRVQKHTPQHHHSLSANSLNQLYNYAHHHALPSPAPRPTAPLVHARSPSYQGLFTPSATNTLPPPTPSPYESYQPQPEVYHGRRRDSTLTISTSQTSSTSGPNTPMTSVSVTFGTSQSEPRYYGSCGSSPKDPRMSIDALCSAL